MQWILKANLVRQPKTMAYIAYQYTPLADCLTKSTYPSSCALETNCSNHIHGNTSTTTNKAKTKGVMPLSPTGEYPFMSNFKHTSQTTHTLHWFTSPHTDPKRKTFPSPYSPINHAKYNYKSLQLPKQKHLLPVTGDKGIPHTGPHSWESPGKLSTLSDVSYDNHFIHTSQSAEQIVTNQSQTKTVTNHTPKLHTTLHKNWSKSRTS